MVPVCSSSFKLQQNPHPTHFSIYIHSIINYYYFVCHVLHKQFLFLLSFSYISGCCLGLDRLRNLNGNMCHSQSQAWTVFLSTNKWPYISYFSIFFSLSKTQRKMKQRKCNCWNVFDKKRNGIFDWCHCIECMDIGYSVFSNGTIVSGPGKIARNTHRNSFWLTVTTPNMYWIILNTIHFIIVIDKYVIECIRKINFAKSVLQASKLKMECHLSENIVREFDKFDWTFFIFPIHSTSSTPDIRITRIEYRKEHIFLFFVTQLMLKR